MKEVFEDRNLSQKTPEKTQKMNVAGDSPSAEKPQEAKTADKEGEGSSSSNSTLQKKQVVATVTTNPNTDTEKPKILPQKVTEGDTFKGRKSKKTLGTTV